MAGVTVRSCRTTGAGWAVAAVTMAGCAVASVPERVVTDGAGTAVAAVIVLSAIRVIDTLLPAAVNGTDVATATAAGVTVVPCGREGSGAQW